MGALSADTTLRTETWILERVEKADHLRVPDPGVPEEVLLAVESSIETGFLGAEFVGLAVYAWVLITAGMLLVWKVTHYTRRQRRVRVSAVVFLGAVVVLQSSRTDVQPTFYADDPLTVDPDTLLFAMPQERPLSESFSLLINVFGFVDAADGPAVNVSTTGRVPNSSWFTDRELWTAPERLLRGPNRGTGPDTSKAWNVVSLERDGKSIGMEIVDRLGDRYFLKMDPAGAPEVSTGAEIVSTKFLYALGYHVPENYLVRFRPEILVPQGETVTSARIERLLQFAYRYGDGTVRAMASKHVDGEPVGPFRLHGTRPDDANDIFPHELRRELRGLRVIAAWLNHTDVRSENTLDAAISADGGSYLRHYLLDFGTTLGGSPDGAQRRWAGHEYWLQPLATMRRVLTLGWVDANWETIEYPEIRGVGRFEADHFDPSEWVPFQPNAAFRRMDRDDAFWAAERIGRFTDETIRAVVQSGDYSDPRAVDYIADVLSDRRDQIIDEYLLHGGGLADFRIEGDSVVFDDLLHAFGRADRIPVREATWLAASDQNGGFTPVTTETVSGPSVGIPDAGNGLLRLDLHTHGHGRTRVYIRGAAGSRRQVGLERCSDDAACSAIAEGQAAREDVFAGGYEE